MPPPLEQSDQQLVGQIIDNLAVAKTGLLGSEVISSAWPRQLEEHLFAVGTEHGEEDGNDLRPEFLLHPVAVFLHDLLDRHRLADLAGFHMDQFQVFVRSRIPMASVNRDPGLLWGTESHLAIFHEHGLFERGDVHGHHPPTSITAVVIYDSGAAGSPLLASRAMSILGRDI